MSAETVKPNLPPTEGERFRHVDREIKEMVSALTSRLTSLQHGHKAGSSHDLGGEDEHGVRIITLAGTNTGATMRGGLLGDHHKHENRHEDSPEGEFEEGSDTYVNSNYQAVNNSIMLSASYTSNDPGVHLEIADAVDSNSHRHDRHGRRGRRKEKEPVHDNPVSDFSE